MTLPTLRELECPSCHATTWVIESDYPGDDGRQTRSEDRERECQSCRRKGTGWELRQVAWAFLSQPSEFDPMSQKDFDYWVGILRANFPDHPALARLGDTFYPFLPEEALAREEERRHAHPVMVMLDQDGARKITPDAHDALEWLGMMEAGSLLRFVRHDEAELEIAGAADGPFVVTWRGPPSQVSPLEAPFDRLGPRRQAFCRAVQRREPSSSDVLDREESVELRQTLQIILRYLTADMFTPPSRADLALPQPNAS